MPPGAFANTRWRIDPHSKPASAAQRRDRQSGCGPNTHTRRTLPPGAAAVRGRRDPPAERKRHQAFEGRNTRRRRRIRSGNERAEGQQQDLTQQAAGRGADERGRAGGIAIHGRQSPARNQDERSRRTAQTPRATDSTMRSDEEILARIEAITTRDWMGTQRVDLIQRLPVEKARPLLKDDADVGKWTVLPRDDTSVKDEMHRYMSFAWEKANHRRGISASRSLEHMNA